MTQQLETIATNFAALGFDGRSSIRFKIKNSQNVEEQYQVKLLRDGETSLDFKVKNFQVVKVKYKRGDRKRTDKFEDGTLSKMKQQEDGDDKGSQLRYRKAEKRYRHEIGNLKYEEELQDLTGDTLQVILGPAPGTVSEVVSHIREFLESQDFTGFRRNSVKIRQEGNIVTIRALGTRVEINLEPGDLTEDDEF